MSDGTPKILIPFIAAEADPVKEACRIANKSPATIRAWAACHHIGRRVGGGVWLISRPALLMFLNNDHRALRQYLSGDRSSDLVLSYFANAGVTLPSGGVRDAG